MFELGVIQKRLRSSADRSKFYRLIEALLYGGIPAPPPARCVTIAAGKQRHAQGVPGYGSRAA